MAGYLACLAVLYGVTAHQASWGGPLWWPAAGRAPLACRPCPRSGSLPGRLLPSRFTAPLAAVAAFFVLALSTELILGSQSYWQISPVVTGPWDIGPDAGVGDLLPLPSRPVHRPADVPPRAHHRGAGRPGTAQGLRRAAAAHSRRGRHRGRPAGGRNRCRTGRNRQARRPRHDRHPGPARCRQ